MYFKTWLSEAFEYTFTRLKLQYSVNSQLQSVAPRLICSSVQATWEVQE